MEYKFGAENTSNYLNYSIKQMQMQCTPLQNSANQSAAT
jgi:hypothetical protein